ncbi:MAG: type II toxin-antitoxin system PemK/MazF family toxin [Prevotellaceae bacterium]|nr:type II toxin-antitoxin system PemK/MazF family toxin [Prevotellaceae bacterium]
MNVIETGSIVLLKFPFTDGITYKRRPVLVLKDFADGDILVCRITSKIYTGKYDIYLDEWEKFGLKLPSVVRVHKMATLETNMIESFMGQIDNDISDKVKSIYNSII